MARVAATNVVQVACLFVAVSGAWANDNVILSGSANLDYRYVSGSNPPGNPSALGLTGLGLEVAMKGVIDFGHGLSFTAKVCGGCHGVEIDQGYGELMLRDALNVRLGRLNVPFGEFNLRHDPVNFTLPSKPLPYAMGDLLYYGPQDFNLGIVPAPYVDNGAELYGTVALSSPVQLDYSVYVVKGLAGSNDLDFAASRRYLDNNRIPAVGTRWVLASGDWALGASLSGGTYDDADTLTYVMGGADFYLRLGKVTLRAEGLFRRTQLDATAPGYRYQLIDSFFLKAGYYAQLDCDLTQALTLSVRADGLFRWGAPLPASHLEGPFASITRYGGGLLYRLSPSLAVKAGYEWWNFVAIASLPRHVARAALVFGY
ncbi:MAG: hypothetical protein K1X64_05570 [Myxococcaceae bacterium]|nr:hypothetical protein [Myxococcaceae bacterium]